MFFKGDTLNLVLTFGNDSPDFTAVDNLYVTFSKLDNGAYTTIVQFEGSDAELTVAAHQITVALSQANTIAFPSTVYGQVTWVDDGERGSSKIYVYTFETPLANEVLPPVTPDPED